MSFIRSKHKWHDLHHLLSDPRLLGALLLVGFLGILGRGLPVVYPLVFVFLAVFLVRAIIGRRCPRCDGSLKERDSARVDGLTFDITWHCPRDGYQEIERVRGGKGSWGDSGH